MDFSKFTIEEKNNICQFWFDNGQRFKSDKHFTPCVLYVDNFNHDLVAYKEWEYSTYGWSTESGHPGNNIYSNFYEAYVGTEFWDDFYSYLNSNFVSVEERVVMLSAPVLQKKIQKLQEQEQVNALFSDTSSKLETVPLTLTSAIGITMAVVISFIAIKKGLKYIIESIKYGKKKHMN